MISFVGTPANQEYTSFALLLQSPMPETVINISLILELRHGKTVSCKLEPIKNISLDNEQVILNKTKPPLLQIKYR